MPRHFVKSPHIHINTKAAHPCTPRNLQHTPSHPKSYLETQRHYHHLIKVTLLFLQNARKRSPSRPTAPNANPRPTGTKCKIHRCLGDDRYVRSLRQSRLTDYFVVFLSLAGSFLDFCSRSLLTRLCPGGGTTFGQDITKKASSESNEPKR